MSYNRIMKSSGLNNAVRPRVTQTLRGMRQQPMGSGPDPNYVRVTATPSRRSMTESSMSRIKKSLVR